MHIALRKGRVFALFSLLVLVAVCVIGLLLISGFAHSGPPVGHPTNGILTFGRDAMPYWTH